MSHLVPQELDNGGSPGAGKSTIASTLASELQGNGLLGSVFCCRQDNVTLSDPATLWRTVASDLAQRDAHFADRVIENMKAGKVDPMRVDIGLHFETLIKDPAAWVSKKYTQVQGSDVMRVHERNLGGMGVTPGLSTTALFPIVILDALDECGSDTSQSTQRRIFMDTLTKWFHFHPMFKLVITSRDQGIRPAFRNACHHITLETGDLVSAQSNLDIKCFFEQRFADMASSYPSLPLLWPGESTIKQLTDLAAGLFIWAETVARFLEQGFPNEQLKLVLDGNFREEGNEIDKLYHQILRLSFKNSKPHVLHTFKKVIGAILLAKIPLHRSDLYHFLGRLEDSSSIDFILAKLSSVISANWDANRPIHIIHLSFIEFLCDPKRCHEIFFIDRQTHSQIMALACFRAMNMGLQFNICQIETSYLPNDALNLAPRIKKAIPTHLSYSCLFGMEHLQDSAFDGEILQEVKTFMYTRLLFWLEVLSLLKEVKTASRALLSISKWSSIYDEDVVVFSRDASKFVTAFMSVISHSAPHIYLSALPFAPKQSKVLHQYLPQFPQTIFIEAGQAIDWPAIQNVLKPPLDLGNLPKCVAFSQDGKHIVSGSDYGAIFVWDADTGAIISGPFQDAEYLLSVTFSQDDKCVVSFTSDGTICIWEVGTGAVISVPCQKRSESHIISAASSLDGKRIVSCSDDGRIEILHVETGTVVAGPFQPHESCVTSVACSRDATYIVSGSNYGEICVYDLGMEAVAFSAFQGHVGEVDCLALSPDGHRIVSGSRSDATIRIWDTKTGTILSEPFQWDTSNISCAAFSPDGQRVVSCSNDDQTIRIWDANTGATISGPFYGHAGPIFSLAFSPDGQRVVSCSEDGTFRIWDVAVGAILSGPGQGHSRGVLSVAFSQDSKYVVSASRDNTICIWSTGTGGISFRSFEYNLRLATFSEDNKHIISGSGDNTITIWDVDMGTMVSSKSAPGQFPFGGPVISQDGRHAVLKTINSENYLWNTEMGIVSYRPIEDSHANATALSHNCKRVSGDVFGGGICIWGPETAAVVSDPFLPGINSVKYIAFSWDDKLVVTRSVDGMICVLHVETGTIASGPFKCWADDYSPVAFSPDSKRIVSCSFDCTICIWDAETGELISGPFRGHTMGITSVAFSADGKRLVSGSEDMTIRIWDVESKEHALPIKSNAFLSAFKDNSKMVDGWILGPNAELLFWVPPLHQTVLWRPSNISVIGRHSTRIDFSHFVHGTSWARCSSWV